MFGSIRFEESRELGQRCNRPLVTCTRRMESCIFSSLLGAQPESILPWSIFHHASGQAWRLLFAVLPSSIRAGTQPMRSRSTTPLALAAFTSPPFRQNVGQRQSSRFRWSFCSLFLRDGRTDGPTRQDHVLETYVRLYQTSGGGRAAWSSVVFNLHSAHEPHTAYGVIGH